MQVVYDETGQIWVMLHSGSRYIGNSTAKYYDKQAVEYMKGTGSAKKSNNDINYLELASPAGQAYLQVAPPPPPPPPPPLPPLPGMLFPSLPFATPAFKFRNFATAFMASLFIGQFSHQVFLRARLVNRPTLCNLALLVSTNVHMMQWELLV